MKTELKACPWCSGAAHVHEGGNWYGVGCNTIALGVMCFGYCQARQYPSEAEAAAAWNRCATPPSPSTAEVDELLGRYWEIAYSEGKTGEPRGSEAQEVLSSLRAALASRPAVEAGELEDATVFALLQKAGATDADCRTIYAGHGLTLHWTHVTGLIRAALATKPATSAPGAAGDRGGE
ncbi:hypothetical protein HH212_00175 [Massilia forsythiae]|uniref:Uncharacterized protein n=1 Tax=Massilia forsythiae TaxID=2728020 RepID=A0A7Z2VT67_9BURK|nr:Lar family restriction alleviation protein [Massilia forsythiae]QJD98652.1 hypothetical protein HH212_00175 [Massilia forsythiae]